MWKLVLEDGAVIRDGCATQWDALRTARTKDGKAFKKADAMSVQSGTIVFRPWYRNQTIDSAILDKEGNIMGYAPKKIRAPRMEKCLVFQYLMPVQRMNGTRRCS